MNALIATAALAAGNFIYQFIQADPNWAVALERSFFQGMAIMIYVLIWGN